MISNVIVLDKSPLIRLGLNILLQEHHYNVTHDNSEAKGLLHAIYSHQPDLLIIEHLFQTENIPTLIRFIKFAFPKLKILILSEANSAFFPTYYKFLGIDGYLCKTTSREDVINCIERINNGEKCFPLIFSSRIEKPSEDNEIFFRLTDNELYILQQLCQEKAPKNIARKMNITNKKVSASKISIMQKMKINRTIELLEIARRNHIF